MWDRLLFFLSLQSGHWPLAKGQAPNHQRACQRHPTHQSAAGRGKEAPSASAQALAIQHRTARLSGALHRAHTLPVYVVHPCRNKFLCLFPSSSSAVALSRSKSIKINYKERGKQTKHARESGEQRAHCIARSTRASCNGVLYPPLHLANLYREVPLLL